MSSKPRREEIDKAIEFALKKQADAKLRLTSNSRLQEDEEAAKEIAWRNFDRETAIQIATLIRR